MKEHDIRPQSVFDEYLELCRKDVQTFFAHSVCRRVCCPACGGWGYFAFHKEGFSYEECLQCLTLYVSPRPDKQAFDRYYTDSPSTKFWATTFYRTTEDARREKLWRPKARLVAQKMEQFDIGGTIVDIGGGYGTFAEEVIACTAADVLVIEPSVHLAEVCRRKGLAVLQKFLEEVEPLDLPEGRRCFVSFELFEHLYDPRVFLTTLFQLMAPGDGFIFTTLSGAGVDIRALWEKSKSVHPPHHLNFFTPHSIRQLLSKAGFSTLEVTTPGKLDIDIMFNNVDKIADRFWRSFLLSSNEATRQTMQDFLATNLLSSHMMVACKKGA